jgi:hypothetical protein
MGGLATHPFSFRESDPCLSATADGAYSMNRSLQMLASAYLLSSILVLILLHQFSPPALAFEDTSKLAVQPQSLQELFESEFAILRLQGNQARVAGVGFVIHQSPTRILTCYHVVSEGVELNDGPVSFGIEPD